MKVIAFQSDSQVLVSMSVSELMLLTGFNRKDDFNKAFGTCVSYLNTAQNLSDQKGIINIDDYPVSTLYKEARETLAAYEELQSKFTSIRNQLNVLLQKMVSVKSEAK